MTSIDLFEEYLIDLFLSHYFSDLIETLHIDGPRRQTFNRVVNFFSRQQSLPQVLLKNFIKHLLFTFVGTISKPFRYKCTPGLHRCVKNRFDLIYP